VQKEEAQSFARCRDGSQSYGRENVDIEPRIAYRCDWNLQTREDPMAKKGSQLPRQPQEKQPKQGEAAELKA
jgi:hypothetical protein